MAQIDFNELKSQVSIQQVVEWLKLSLTPQGGQLRGECPISQSTQKRAFIVTPSKGAFICFCPECKKLPKQGGDVIELVARMRRVGHKEAAGEIARHFLSGAVKADDNARQQPQTAADDRKPSGFDPLTYQRSLLPDHEALTVLGISPQTIRQLGGGYAGKGVMRGRLTLPIQRDEAILGFLGLALKGETPEILYPKDFKPPYFFGMQLVGEGTLYLVQDLTQLLHSVENGMENVVCPLQPLTALSLSCLSQLMKERRTDELEIL